jgi:hypothetical protein
MINQVGRYFFFFLIFEILFMAFLCVSHATGGKAAEESSFKKLGPRQWGAKAGVQKLGPDVVNKAMRSTRHGDIAHHAVWQVPCGVTNHWLSLVLLKPLPGSFSHRLFFLLGGRLACNRFGASFFGIAGIKAQKLAARKRVFYQAYLAESFRALNTLFLPFCVSRRLLSIDPAFIVRSHMPLVLVR